MLGPGTNLEVPRPGADCTVRRSGLTMGGRGAIESIEFTSIWPEHAALVAK
jgi:hypothetical protein